MWKACATGKSGAKKNGIVAGVAVYANKPDRKAIEQTVEQLLSSLSANIPPITPLDWTLAPAPPQLQENYLEDVAAYMRDYQPEHCAERLQKLGADPARCSAGN